MPNGRCYLHGGKSLGGIASPRFKNGIYSKYVPKTLRNDFEALLKDKDLTELREELALLTLRSGELLSRLENQPPPWEEVLAKFKLLKKVQDETRKQELLGDIEKLLEEGVSISRHQRMTWNELREVIQEKTRTASAEWSRLHDLQGLVKLDTIMGLWRGVLEAIRSEVRDPVQLRAITGAVMRFMPPPSTVVIEGNPPHSQASA